jgi:putative membrane protein
MKAIGIPAIVLGLTATVLLVGHYGFGAVGTALASIGWAGFLAIAGIHLAIIALCGTAWFALVPPLRKPALWAFVWGRLVREGGSEVLPLSQIGGFVLGARAVTLAGLSARMAVASVVVDVTMELLSQLAYTGLALGILAALRPQSALAVPIAGGLAVAGVVAVLLVLAQRRGFHFVKRITDVMTRRWAHVTASGIAAVQTAIDEIYCRHRGLLAGFFLHLFSWIASAGEVWFALRLMGAPLGPGPVLAIEGLLYAARGAAFAVPSALGVQEGLYVVLGGIFGMGPETALALSLLKRARDLSLGVPSLVVWQLVEGRRLWRRRPVQAAVLATKEGTAATATLPIDGI